MILRMGTNSKKQHKKKESWKLALRLIIPHVHGEKWTRHLEASYKSRAAKIWRISPSFYKSKRWRFFFRYLTAGVSFKFLAFSFRCGLYYKRSDFSNMGTTTTSSYVGTNWARFWTNSVGYFLFVVVSQLDRAIDGNHIWLDLENFNKRISRIRKSIECAFGIAYAKWRLLSRKCVLHNVIIDKKKMPS